MDKFINILITTGDINEDYEIIDAIFALDSCTEVFLKVQILIKHLAK